jgi:flavin-dependent dehydrogenase
MGETCGPQVRRSLEAVCGLSIPPATYSPLNTLFSAWGSDEIDGRSFAFWLADNGLVLERSVFDDWLLSSAKVAGVRVLRGCHISDGSRSSEGWILSALIEGREQRLSADFVVEATGAKARSILQMDATRIFTDSLVCLFFKLQARSSQNPEVLIESCADGWWYTAMLPAGQRILAFFTDADLVEPIEGRRSGWLNAIFQKTLHTRRIVGEFPQDTEVRICSARTSARNVLWRDAWISVGDAAWSLDPLSGTGIERAIKDGISAAAAISNWLETGNVEQIRSHAVSRANSFREALAAQRAYYAVETRWRDTAFWRRRI